MDVSLPYPDDNLSILIHLKLCSSGTRAALNTAANFNCVVERLRNFNGVRVCDDPSRVVYPNFVTTLKDCQTSWNEFQLHRKVFGLIAVAFVAASDTSNADQVLQRFADLANCRIDTVLDVWKVVFGIDQARFSDLPDNLSCYESFETFGEFENDVRDYVKSVFWILESRRLDLSFEKLDRLICPSVPEEATLINSLDKSSRSYRKRCLGRLRKQVADCTLMTGLSALALDAYSASIDCLKAVNDFLWLAGAYEGCACAAATLKYGRSLCLPIHRVSTYSPGQLKELIKRSAESPSISHRVPLSATVLKVTFDDIVTHFRFAIENYRKFSFAVNIECECVFKALWTIVKKGRFTKANDFINVYALRFLDGNFSLLTELQKSRVSCAIADVYNMMSFNRKMAFFLRLAALLRSSVHDCRSMTYEDYRATYRLLLQASESYLTSFAPADVQKDGWMNVKFTILNECYITALKAKLLDAAIRHLVQMIQTLWPCFEQQLLCQAFAELSTLCHGRSHNSAFYITLKHGALIAPLRVVNLPKLMAMTVLRLDDDLMAVQEDNHDRETSVFIYTPMQTDRCADDEVCLIAGTATRVQMKFSNPADAELNVRHLRLRCDGVSFEQDVDKDHNETDLVLPPLCHAAVIELHMTPLHAGILVVTGYSCDLFGVQNACRLEDLPWLRLERPLQFDVMPALPLLKTSLVPVDHGHDNHVPSDAAASMSIAAVAGSSSSSSLSPSLSFSSSSSSAIRIYVGQKLNYILRVVNDSAQTMHDLRWYVEPTPAPGAQPLIEVMTDDHRDQDEDWGPLISGEIDQLSPMVSRSLHLSVHGLQSALADSLPTFDAVLASKDGTTSLPSIEPSCVSASVRFIYYGSKRNESQEQRRFRRTKVLRLNIIVVPAVLLLKWHVLPGECPVTRYIAMDVLNATDSEVKLEFSATKNVLIQPKDVNRVPVKVNCYELTAAAKDHALETDSVDPEIQKTVAEHLRAQLNIRWLMSDPLNEGTLAVSSILDSSRVVTEFSLPPVSVEISVNGSAYSRKADIEVAVGETVRLAVRMSILESYLTRMEGKLSLEFYLDFQNGKEFDISGEVVFIGPTQYLFSLAPAQTFNDYFEFLFCSEGVFHVNFVPEPLNGADELFCQLKCLLLPLAFTAVSNVRLAASDDECKHQVKLLVLKLCGLLDSVPIDQQSPSLFTVLSSVSFSDDET